MEPAAVVPLPTSPGMLLLEHLNLNVMSTEVAIKFYEALGCVRDARRPMNKTLHSHCGALTQFHTPSPANEAYIQGAGAQRWRGDIELLFDGPDSMQAAVGRVRALMDDDDFAGSELAVDDDGDGPVTVVGPWGNVFKLAVAAGERMRDLGTTHGQRPGSEASTCVGMGGVTLHVPPGSAARGARFYQEVLGFEVRELAPDRWAIVGGPGGESQLYVLEECEGVSGLELGEHAAIYVGDFEGCFERLLARGLVFVNPRFEHLDCSRTLDEAMHFSCFRFKDIVDLESGELLFQLEHEVRSLRHKSCPLRPPEEAA